MKIYLDTSVLDRVFDNQTQARIAIEIQAFRIVLQLIEVKLLNSFLRQILSH
jgi:hypothetical protein